MSISNYQLASFCESALQKPTLYMWGTYGKTITNALLTSKVKQYPKNYSEARQQFIKSKINGKTIGCDCAGLIKWALWTNCNINASIKYQSSTDRGTAGLYNAAKEKGKISTLPEQPGVIVYKKGHVGVYVGNGKVIECTLGSRGDGVVKTDLGAAGWTYWLKLPEVSYVPINTHDNKKNLNIVQKLLSKWRIDR